MSPAAKAEVFRKLNTEGNLLLPNASITATNGCQPPPLSSAGWFIPEDRFYPESARRERRLRTVGPLLTGAWPCFHWVQDDAHFSNWSLNVTQLGSWRLTGTLRQIS